MTLRNKKLREGSYYAMEDGTTIKVMCDTGAQKVISGTKYGGKVYCEDLLGSRLERPRDDFNKAKRVSYRPDIQTLWKLASTISIENGCPWMKQLELFFSKLIEFDHLKIRTLGYFYKAVADNKTSIGESLAYTLAERFQHAFSEPGNERTKLIKSRLLAWATNPTQANREKIFLNTFIDGSGATKIVEVSPNGSCPVTGERFRWSCNGKTIWPTKRCFSKKERQEITGKMKTELEELRAKKRLSPKQTNRRDTLIGFFETRNGWIDAYQYTDLGKVIPFKKAYGDPATGDFPKVVVEIDVPTGKLVFANSLFDYLKDFERDEKHATKNSVNSQRGRANNSYFQARENQAFYINLSNCSPQVWQKKNNPSVVRIGRVSDDPRNSEWSYQTIDRDWNEHGWICTDLWAFHACDRSRLPESIEVNHFIIDVPAGRYRLVNNYEHEGEASGIFCEIERVSVASCPSASN